MSGPVITLDVWRLPRARAPLALWRMARDRSPLRSAAGVRFAKLLGTGSDQGFGPADADLTRWAALVCWDGPARRNPVADRWDRIAEASCRLELRVLSSRGRWAGEDPFAPAAGSGPAAQMGGLAGQVGGLAGQLGGPVVALTRARLRPSRAVRFWRAVPAVATAVAGAPGLITTFGVGEAPLGWQGTVSVWATPKDLVAFAYRGEIHRRVMERTPAENWYAEELFARFELLDVAGDRSVIGWER